MHSPRATASFNIRLRLSAKRHISTAFLPLRGKTNWRNPFSAESGAQKSHPSLVNSKMVASECQPRHSPAKIHPVRLPEQIRWPSGGCSPAKMCQACCSGDRYDSKLSPIKDLKILLLRTTAASVTLEIPLSKQLTTKRRESSYPPSD